MRTNLTISPRGGPQSFGSRIGGLIVPPLARLNWPVIGIAAILLGIGVTMIYAMSGVDDLYLRDGVFGVSWQGHVKKLVVAAPMALIGMACRPRWLRRYAVPLYVAALGLLALVPIIGIELNNSKRWIATPVGFDLQPSEFCKLGLILVLARFFYRRRPQTLADWVPPALLTAVPMAFVAAQPDLGTALTIVPIFLGMCYLAGARGGAILGLVILAAGLGMTAWKFSWVQDYQLRRIDTWAASFDPETLIANRNGAAFHTYHARVAIGNGGVLGTGLGRGVANQAGHLPERESDSIFAVIAEEGGLLGTSVFLVIYTLFVCLLLTLSGGIRERFSRLVIGGVALYFGAHFFINIGVNVGLLPMTGLTLPLLSTGGSSLLTSLLALGIALGLAARAEPSLDQDAFRT